MTTDMIRYDLLTQDALRGVVRKVLDDAARMGLPGEHHFYISFHTGAAGVKISPRLREKHPEEMTIVLQHQFWDLIVTDQAFEVGLSFGGTPERLYVPFHALTGFFDPSVKFGVKFEPAEVPEEAPAEPEAPPQEATEPTPLKKPRASAKSKKSAKSEEEETPAAEAPASEEPSTGAQIVSLDKFRKK